MPTARSGGGYATYNGRIYIGGGEWISREVMASFRALEAYDPRPIRGSSCRRCPVRCTATR
jgi:hypothetical protein